MPESMAHLSEWTLEQLAEGALPAEERAEVEAHLARCARCATELDAYRSLFAALGELPRFAPALDFGDAVMARVRVGPHPSPVLLRVRRWLPTTRRGWAFLAAALVAPALPVLALVVWLLSQPLVSAASLGRWGTLQARTGAETLWSALLQSGLSGGVLSWGASLWKVVEGIPAVALVVVLVVLAVAIPLSAWSLVRLLRTPMESINYAN